MVIAIGRYLACMLIQDCMCIHILYLFCYYRSIFLSLSAWKRSLGGQESCFLQALYKDIPACATADYRESLNVELKHDAGPVRMLFTCFWSSRHAA